MKIKVSKLGVIEQAEIELKPLTVFIGRSGTGKTWTAYTLASIFSKYGFKEYLEAYSEKKNQVQYEILERGIQEFLQGGNCQINLVDFAEKYAENYINDVAGLAPNWLSKFLNTARVNFHNLNINLTLAEFKKEFIESIKKRVLEKRIKFGSNISIQILKQEHDDYIYFYRISEGGKDNLKLPSLLIKDLFSETILGIIHQCFYSYVYIFPTERTTYAGFPFSVQKRVKITKLEKIIEDIQEDNDQDLDNQSPNQKQKVLTQVIELLNSLDEEADTEKSNTDKQKRSIGKSAVIQSLTSIIAGASVKTDDERKEEAEKNPQILEYIDLANFLQEHILSGHVKVDSSTIQNEIIFQPSEDVNLEMQVASSMVKELAPLYLCLRYLVEPNELLIIDEPEMNLHPAAQVEITEFLAMLVNAGVNVLITTHSPYIIDHLSNLIKAAECEDKESIKERFYLERTDAFIAQENVSVYLFEDATAKDILQENGRIDWGTFADISDDISHIFP
ncbi:AAA family ATPase [Anabaena sp. FACHB-1237]|uniref:AAA family ATPase n=1 Tax=Anabaena sp. FACHB-1237 TaxID=2692769 RepID=UPI001681BBD2|nr:AAA family ATPase [Anabaena sp. FACHB-1237]MBD2137600.1 AAA family ATPase [Anabaena sp. FACHB-1237]